MNLDWDLVFQADVSLGQLQEALLDRFHYQVGHLSANYLSEESGATFHLDFGIPIEHEFEKPNPEHPLKRIHFSIRCPHPACSAEEVRQELEALDRALPFKVWPPFAKDALPFSGAQFLQACHESNLLFLKKAPRESDDKETDREGLPEMTFEQAEKLPRLPRAILNRNWAWNRKIAPLREANGNEPFIPQIHCAHWDSKVISLITWMDGIPSYFPEVDFVMLERHNLAPRGWLFRKADKVMIPWEKLEPHLRRQASIAEGVFLLEQPINAAFEAELRLAHPPAYQLEPFPPGLVQDEELFQKSC